MVKGHVSSHLWNTGQPPCSVCLGLLLPSFLLCYRLCLPSNTCGQQSVSFYPWPSLCSPVLGSGYLFMHMYCTTSRGILSPMHCFALYNSVHCNKHRKPLCLRGAHVSLQEWINPLEQSLPASVVNLTNIVLFSKQHTVLRRPLKPPECTGTLEPS